MVSLTLKMQRADWCLKPTLSHTRAPCDHKCVTLFPTQVYPAYLDAPATKLALLPEGARFSCGYAPDVVMGFAAPAGLRDIEVCDVRAARQALDMWRCVVRTTAAASGGYECQEREGVFMLAFQDAGEVQGAG